MIRYVIGIDEAGRGPLAGPVSVAAVAIPLASYKKVIIRFREAKDSKQLTGTQREVWFKKIKSSSGDLIYSVSLVGNAFIDRHGITRSIEVAIFRTLRKLKVAPSLSRVLLDGSLKAPKDFWRQRTIIRGDEKIKIISLASIVAKVSRDRHMVKKAKVFDGYGFEIHKGYGTKKHQQALFKKGPSPFHRQSFLKNFRFEEKQKVG